MVMIKPIWFDWFDRDKALKEGIEFTDDMDLLPDTPLEIRKAWEEYRKDVEENFNNGVIID